MQKKSGCEQSGELYSNFPKILSPAQKTTLTTNSAFDNWILIGYATPERLLKEPYIVSIIGKN